MRLRTIMAFRRNVVPLAGHVDRNFIVITPSLISRQVVPLAGHVDRNQPLNQLVVIHQVSCPSRGTWIEMAAFVSVLYYAMRRAPRGARG